MRGLLIALLMQIALPLGAAEAPVWAIDPLAAQPDLPPAGTSAFDRVFASQGRHRVPYPFTALLRALRTHAGVDALGRPGLKHVLIPLGRSLQRTAAAPQFFRYPRVVVAIDGEPRDGRSTSVLLKDRLYIGYQEKAGVLEVISYNDDAGRFEFQLVKNYRAGATPQVFHANRAVCVSCHQNHAPIFSRQQWDETNANPRVAAALAREAPAYFGIAVARGVDEPYAIDNATDRANQFAAWQRLWNEGCGGGEAGERCRAGAFVAALQLRLSGGAFDRDAEGYRAFRAMLAANWKRLWPAGLALPSANLPNRNPFGSDPDAQRAAVAVPAAFEPLAVREPLETWTHTNADDIDRLVPGLAEFIAQSDLAMLERLLALAGGKAARERLSMQCASVARKEVGAATRLTTTCVDGASHSRARVKLYIKGTTVTGGAIDAPVLEGTPLSAFEVGPGKVASSSARMPLRAGRGVARDARGDRLDAVTLDWSGQPARLSVERRRDFEAVHDAVRRMLARRDPGLADGPIRRSALLDGLYRELDPRAKPRCCGDAPRAPAPRLEGNPRDPSTLRAEEATLSAGLDLTGFYRACGTCHDTPDALPPNFLAGEPATVDAQFRQCAPRIRARLHAWKLDPAQRTKTPMPPPLGVHLLGTTTAAFVDSDALNALLRIAEAAAAPTQPTDDPAPLDRDYEDLPACMPSARGRDAAHAAR